MTSDDELDAFLTSALQEPALEDRGFSRVASERLRRHRRRRRAILACVSAIATAAASAVMAWSPAPVFTSSLVTPETVAATLILAAVCSLVWIGTEPAALGVDRT